MKRIEMYFILLGIGIGVFVSGLVVNQYPTPRIEYSDEEIKEQARELGMIGIRESIESNEENQEEDNTDTSSKKTIKILEGDTTDDIVDKLVAAGIVADGSDFRQFAIQETNGGKAFRQGTYSIDPSAKYEEIVNILTKGAF